jgi:hypothetical protein
MSKMQSLIGTLKKVALYISSQHYLEKLASRIKNMKLPSVSSIVSNIRTIVEVVILVIVAVIIGKYEFTRRNLTQSNLELQQNISASNLAIGQAATKLGDADKKLKELDAKFQKEIKDLNAQVVMYSDLLANYNVSHNGVATITLGADGKFTGSFQDTRLHIDYVLSPPNKMDISYNLDLKLRGQMVQTVDKNGIIHDLFHLYEVDEKNKDIGELKLTKYEVTIDDQNKTKSFLWSANHLSLNGFVGFNTFNGFGAGVSLGYSPFGYGYNLHDMSFRFPELTLDLIEKMPGIGLTPLSWNIGNHMSSLFTNIWIGPHVSLSVGGGSLGLALGCVL